MVVISEACWLSAWKRPEWATGT